MMAVDADTFRQVMSQFATGVTVITTAAGEAKSGMTVSAFSSLSLNPTLVLVCIDDTARTKPLLDESGNFAVNILAEDQSELSQLFASKKVDIAERFREVRHRIGRTGSPLIEGCVAYLDCKVAMTYPGGDHTIYVGEVMDASFNPQIRPLVYYKGKYRALVDLPVAR